MFLIARRRLNGADAGFIEFENELQGFREAAGGEDRRLESFRDLILRCAGDQELQAAGAVGAVGRGHIDLVEGNLLIMIRVEIGEGF